MYPQQKWQSQAKLKKLSIWMVPSTAILRESFTLLPVKNAKKQYIGQTGRKLRDRFGEHLHNITIIVKALKYLYNYTKLKLL